MAYKRADKMLKAAGIDDIKMSKGIHGVAPHIVGVYKQESKVFKTWQLATQAVIDGYRPTVIQEHKS